MSRNGAATRAPFWDSSALLEDKQASGAVVGNFHPDRRRQAADKCRQSQGGRASRRRVNDGAGGTSAAAEQHDQECRGHKAQGKHQNTNEGRSSSSACGGINVLSELPFLGLRFV